MDSLTQLLLGAAVAGLAAPARHRRAALLVGGVLGTLPDLDVLALLAVDDPVRRMVWHRSASHSLLVLAPFAQLLWGALRATWTPVREAPARWLAAIALALLTHPLLDAHTVYGTQLWWPLPVAPAMWSTVFIIDPLYTLPLAVAVLLAWRGRERAGATRALALGVGVSCAYLGWSWIAKAQVDARFDAALAAAGHGAGPRFSVPTPFNTRIWRAVAFDEGVLIEGFVDVFARTPARVRSHARLAPPRPVAAFAAVERLDWFAHGFVDFVPQDDALLLRDVRMGGHPHYVFRFVVAERHADGWREAPVRQLPPPDVGWDELREQWRAPQAR